MKSLFHFDRAGVSVETMARCTLGFAAPLLIGAAYGQPAAGVLAALGALYSGLASFRGAYAHRLRLMLATSVVTSAATLLGSFLSARPNAAVFVITLAAFLFAVLSAGGAAAGILSIQATAILVVVAGIRSTAGMPWANTGLVLAGGLIQVALLFAFWPLFGRIPERKALAEAFGSLGRFVRSIVDSDGEGDAAPRIPDRAPFQEAWEVVGQTNSNEQARLLTEGEAIRAGLAGFARAYRHHPPNANLRAEAGRIADALEAVTNAVQRGLPVPSLARPARAAMRDPHPDLDPNSGATDDREFIRWLRFFWSRIEDLRAPSSGAARPSLALNRIPVGFNLLGSIELRSLVLKHAVRYGAAVGAAVALSHVWGISHAYWLPLTVSITLRADYASTIDRSAARLVGTVIGVACAEGLLVAVHPNVDFLLGMAILGGCLGFALYLANYMLYSAAITLYVVGAISAATAHAPHIGADRLIATAAGAALAITANFLAPIWQSRQVMTVLAEAVRAHIAFGERIVEHDMGPEDLATRESQQRARALHIEAEKVVAAVAAEPHWSREKPAVPPEEVLDRLDDNAAVLLALYAGADRPAESASSSPPGSSSAWQDSSGTLGNLSREAGGSETSEARARDALNRTRALLVRLEAA